MRKILLLIFICISVITLAQDFKNNQKTTSEKLDKFQIVAGLTYDFITIDYKDQGVSMFQTTPSFASFRLGTNYVLFSSEDFISLSANALPGFSVSFTRTPTFLFQAPVYLLGRIGTGSTRFNNSKVGLGLGVGGNFTYLALPYTTISGRNDKISQSYVSPSAMAEVTLKLRQTFTIRFSMNLLPSNGYDSATSVSPNRIEMKNYSLGLIYTYLKFMKSILITGASTGIGESTAIFLARSGFKVYAGYRKSDDGEKLSQQDKNLIPIKLDVTNSGDILNVFNEILNSNDDFIALINNAGIATASPLEGIPMEDFRNQMEINVMGLLAMSQAFIPLLRKTQGKIINIGSISGKVATPFLGPYSASKFAVEAISDSMRMELKPWNIKVVCVEPGSIKTPIWNKSLDASKDLEMRIDTEIRNLYAKQIESIQISSKLIEKRGIDSIIVAKLIERIVRSENPKARYLVGKDAVMQKWLKWLLPDKWLDKLICKQLRLPY